MFESLEVLDNVSLSFSQEGLFFMNVTLAFIMFGVALEIKIENFKKIFLSPKNVIIGIVAQFILLPAITFALILILKPSVAVSLGMILVASCPGGNISNFISSLAKANVALSVSLTSVSDIISVILTPFNFAFWGSLYIQSSPLLRPIEIPIFHVIQTILLLLGIPLVVGIWFSKKFPETTKKIIKPIKIASIFAFFGFVVGAFASNFDHFLDYIHLVVVIVLIHNALALSTGFLISTIFKLSKLDRRTITIETGIQNSGVALVLIFNPTIFPPELELGGMAFIAAWWGIWHMVSGTFISLIWGSKFFNRHLS